MDALKRHVFKVRRRLLAEQFVSALAWSWFAALAVAALGIAVVKIWPIDVNGRIWATSWIGGSLGVGLLVATIWTYVVRRSPLDAALEIDRRCGLKERISSTMSLAPDELSSEAGQALVADAQRRIDRLDVREHFRVRPQRRALLPLAPAVAVFALLLVADRGADNRAIANAETEAKKKAIDGSSEQVRKLAKKRENEAKELGLKEAEKLFHSIEERTREIADRAKADPKKAISELNDVVEKIEQRRQQLGGDDKLRKQLDQMKNFNQGPADGLAKAMKNGDFKKALDELNKLKDQLAKNELDPDKKKELGDQLAQMEKALQKLADAQQQAKANAENQLKKQQQQQTAEEKSLKKQIEQAKQKGDQETAENLQKQLDHQQAGATSSNQQLQQQIDKLGQNDAQMQRMRNLADKLAKAQQAMQQGDPQQAQQAMDQLAKDLAGLKQESDEMAMLDQALEQIEQAKQSMNCKQCNGQGCEACQGKGQGQGQQSGQTVKGKRQGGDGKGDGKGDGDFAKGRGQASGRRGEEKTDFGTKDSRVGQKVGAGGAVVKDLVDGPNIKGQVTQQIKDATTAAKHEEADPLVGQRLPRSQREHAKEYFDSLRKGE